jgi:hypothetical protein
VTEQATTEPIETDVPARVGARYWGPGRFRAALREAFAEGRAKPLPRGRFAPVEPPRKGG